MPEVDNSGDDIVLTLESSDLKGKINLFEEKLERVVRFEHKNILLDMKNVNFLDSSILAILIRLRTSLAAEGRTLRLINYNERIIRYIRLAGLEEYLLE